MGLVIANANIVVTVEYPEKENEEHEEHEKYKEKNIRTEEENMEKYLNANFRQSTNYLIQLFFKTGKKYSCTRTKLGKLLTIASFVYARKNEVLFSEAICKYNNCGTLINALTLFIEREVYLELEYVDNKQYIDACFDNDIEIPKFYSEVCDVDIELRKVLENVFRHFGSYTASDLGELIVPIINTGKVVNSNEEIDLNEIYRIDKNEILSNNKGNELIEFIF